jgi:uncharacterized SAM-binding protein YcdF (DUF218 family)
MLSYIAKFLPMFFYPLGLAGVFAGVAGALILFNKKKASVTLAFLSAGTLLFFSSPVVSHILVRSLESKFEPRTEFPPVSAIVLLGGCTRPVMPPRINVEVTAAGDRIFEAARVYRKGCASFIITTGGKIPFIYDFPGSEAMCMASVLREVCGVDSSHIIVEDDAENTHEHAPNVAAILQQRGLKPEIILVTSAMHMYRSIRIFRKNGYTVYPAPADFREDRNIQWKLFGLVPQADALVASTNVLHEYYGIIAYKILGWL